jgi:hypothetical protein
MNRAEFLLEARALKMLPGRLATWARMPTFCSMPAMATVTRSSLR